LARTSATSIGVSTRASACGCMGTAATGTRGTVGSSGVVWSHPVHVGPWVWSV
jgi:hypothetical protein